MLSAVSAAVAAEAGSLLGGLGTGLGQPWVVRPGPVSLEGQHGGGGYLLDPFGVGGLYDRIRVPSGQN